MTPFRLDEDSGNWLAGGERIWRSSPETDAAKASENAPEIVLGELAAILAVALAIATVVNVVF